LNFWANWCVECVNELKSLSNLQKEFDKLKAEKANAQKDLDAQKITKKEFDEISYDIHKRAMSATKDADPALAASMPRYIKSGDLLVEAITQFKKGAELEIEKMDKETSRFRNISLSY
jgi:thiol-disulfide isomerase/thioredoxin